MGISIVIILLAAILVTLLGAWPIAGIIIGVLFSLWLLWLLLKIILSPIIEVLAEITEDVGVAIQKSSMINFLKNRGKIKELKSAIKRKQELGYETSELDIELEKLRNKNS